jgi:hypothetical protein
MKVGTHAKESLDDIIERKSREIKDAGFALWGYGGNTCHPETMVQPFARTHYRDGNVIYLCMHPMDSNHFADQIRADDFSINGSDWKDIPGAINVLGSRFALAVKDLRPEEFELPLENTRVAIGRSRGASGSRYIKGRVDKACLEITADTATSGPTIHIGIVAELVEPYAVYVRNRPR